MQKFQSPISNLWERECEFINPIRKMERRGILIDQDRCRREIAIGEGTMNSLWVDLDCLRPTSPNHLKRLLLDRLGLPVVKPSKKTGKPSFDKEAMAEYDRILAERADEFGDVAKKIVEYRGWASVISNNYKPYLELVGPDGRLRCEYTLHIVKTSRLSSRKPNLQNIPKESPKRWNGQLNQTFIPKDGYVILVVDYSQLELRLAAAVAEQENLLEIFNDPSQPDVFEEMSKSLGIPRQGCKTITYANMFGAQPNKIALLLGGSNPMSFIKQWEEEHANIVDFADEINKTGRTRGYINLWTGRRRHFQYPSEGRLAFNSYIQGGGAEIVKSAMIRLDNEVDDEEKCRMLLQVHDAVYFEVRADLVEYYRSRIEAVMEDVQREKDFGVRFSVKSEFWGKAA